MTKKKKKQDKKNLGQFVNTWQHLIHSLHHRLGFFFLFFSISFFPSMAFHSLSLGFFFFDQDSHLSI